MSKGIPIIISGPSGAGKTTLYRMAIQTIPAVRHSVSYTTRPPRPGDVDGSDYNFVSGARFEEMARGGEFFEYAHIHGNRYGTARRDLETLLREGSHVILEIDVQGAASLRKALDGAVYIFIAPPSLEACRKRLFARGQDSTEAIERRIRAAVEEVRQAPLYDYVILNEDIEESFQRLRAIITAEEIRTTRMAEKIIKNFSL
ncbi:MAG: guanylate kinase [Thermodesulfobacteriota bacterium]